MIRSNPTAIPLRASDVKLLQAELDKRKNAAASPAPETATANSNSAGTVKAGGTSGNEAYNAVAAAKQERMQKTRNERIGFRGVEPDAYGKTSRE